MSLADETLLVADAGALFGEGRSFSWNLISTRQTQFNYFDQTLGGPVWKGRKILDFGGNVGTFLAAAGDHIDHEDYWCIDLNPAVVEQGRLTYPRAHFMHYNRYSSQYNPDGIRNLPIPDWGMKFDIILAFSVFTHIDRSEMLELVESMQNMLAPGGVLAFTFWDPHYDRSLSDPTYTPGCALRRYRESHGGDESFEQARWCVLIDDELYLEPGDEVCHQIRVGKPLESYLSFFTPDYIKSLFPNGTVHPPVSPEWQHCCVLRKP
jgi:SAM-dependent methyltransferase